MEMLIVVFREALQAEILTLLQECDVKAFTLIQNVVGAGETGLALGSFDAPGLNSMLFIVLPKAHAERSIEVLRTFSEALKKDHPAHRAPIHAFVLPCNQVV